MQDLNAVVRGAFFPESLTAQSRRLDFQDPTVFHDPVQFGKQVGKLGMLQNGIDLPDFLARLLGVGLGNERFQEDAPADGVPLGEIFCRLPAGLLQPEGQGSGE